MPRRARLAPVPAPWPLPYADIRALVVATAGTLCRARGFDVDDLVHDVVARIARNQRTASRYDARRSAPSTYVVRVTRSTVGHWLRRLRVEARVMEQEHQQPDDDTGEVVDAPDEHGLDDEQATRLGAVLDDARRVLGDASIGLQTLVAWLMHDRDVMPLALRCGLTEQALWRYLCLLLKRLELQGMWTAVWSRQRSYAVRRLRKLREQLGEVEVRRG